MSNEDEILKTIIEEHNLDLGNDFIYVGATIIKRTDFPQSTEILYCEDGFNDEDGIPYIMQSIVPKGTFKKDRLIVFYRKDLQRYIIPIDGENYSLIGNGIPKNVKNINYGKAKTIVHRKALELEKEPKKLSEKEIENLYKRYVKFYKKGRMLIAGFLSSIIWLFLVFIATAFIITETNNGYVNETLVIGTLISSTILFFIGTVFIIRFFIKIPARRLKKFVYMSDFLVMNYQRDVNIKGINESHIYGLAYDGNNCKLMTYGISHYDVTFIDNVEYFEIVNRYSKSKSPKNLEYCLFERKNRKASSILLS